jgi:uncharacterized glyoxalase superfamily protein PhnB
MSDTLDVTLFPGLQYADADAAMAWLERTFGCEQREVHRDDAGAIVHAEMNFGSAVVMLSSAGIGREPFRNLPAGGGMVYCAVDRVDELYERARESGAEIVIELMETDYGSKDFTVRDPEGTLWAVGTYRPED